MVRDPVGAGRRRPGPTEPIGSGAPGYCPPREVP